MKNEHITVSKPGKRKCYLNFTLFYFISLTLFIFGTTSCDSSTEPEVKKDLLKVRFTNDSESTFTISNIQLQPMGKAGESTEPTGDWSSNILTGGKRLAPGEYETFNLEIPNLNWSRYRLGVINDDGNEIMIHEQAGYEQFLSDASITHWGSDDRTVIVRVVRDPSSGFIVITMWSDFAGIDG